MIRSSIKSFLNNKPLLKKIVEQVYMFIKRAIIFIRLILLNSIFRLFLRHPKYNKKYSITICGIFKNEASYLKEWIEYHEMIGIEHFYLYNNNSDDNYRDILQP